MLLRFRTSLAVGVAAAMLFCSSAPLPAQKGGSKPPAPTYPYRYTNLGPEAYNNFGGGAKAYGLNEPNDDSVLLAVAGGSSTPSPAFATLWEATAGGTLLAAGTVPDSTRGTVAVNDAGWIAFFGYSSTQAASAGMVSIPGVGIVEFPTWFRPEALNNVGQVVGRDSGADGFVWTVAADGTITDAASLGDFLPFAINDWGEMAGQQGASAAIAWFEDGALRVEKLPGLFAGDFGRAAGINNFGEVVGVSASNSVGTGGALSGNYRPFLWNQTSGLVPLADSGAALDINDHGQVVGWSFNSKGYYAFLWQDGERFDLNVLSGVGTKTFQLATAEAINNAGQIVGRSDTNKGTSHVANGSYLLTPN